MEKAVILDPKAKKTEVLGSCRFILKKVLKKTFSSNGNYLTLEYLKYHFK